jgi:fructokinase
MVDKIFGGIEAGGTKFVCVAAGGPQDIRAETRIETTTPEVTIGKVVAFFRAVTAKYPLQAIGIGSFGPLDLDPASPTRGFITSTPKPGWAQTNLAGAISRALGLPVMLDTDVNAAALGEGKWGSALGLKDYLYLTVGTGIGGGAVVNGSLLHGLMHPEIGHMLIKHNLQKDPFKGCCPYHLDCLEGLASGLAVQKRWDRAARDLPPDHPAWDLEAEYLAQGIVNLICVISPRRVILGGGVLKQPRLFPLVREKVRQILNGYIQSSLIIKSTDQYLVPPGLGDYAGVLGAVALAGGTIPLIS